LNKQANDLKKNLKSLVKANQADQIDDLKQQLATMKETQTLKEH
jgi:regulator of replication initiation timing